MSDDFLTLKTKEDLQRLVEEGLEESLTLDYKDSRALAREGKGPDEMCKDVSALANSAGGQIVYGIQEDKKKGKPVAVDVGVDDPKITREWIDQILASRVHPRLQGVRIDRIELDPERYGYVITIPPTLLGPHQAPDHKYYKRRELQSVPMEDYEVRDVMRRSTTPALDIDVAFQKDGAPGEAAMRNEGEWWTWLRLAFTVTNLSTQPADHGVLRVSIDRAFRLGNPNGFEPGISQTTIEDSDVSALTANFGVPRSAPIFRESPSMVASVNIALNAKQAGSSDYLVLCDLRSPGFSMRKRFRLAHRDGLLIIGPGVVA